MLSKMSLLCKDLKLELPWNKIEPPSNLSLSLTLRVTLHILKKSIVQKLAIYEVDKKILPRVEVFISGNLGFLTQ